MASHVSHGVMGPVTVLSGLVFEVFNNGKTIL
jgi:hypothetical protein